MCGSHLRQTDPLLSDAATVDPQGRWYHRRRMSMVWQFVAGFSEPLAFLRVTTAPRVPCPMHIAQATLGFSGDGMNLVLLRVNRGFEKLDRFDRLENSV